MVKKKFIVCIIALAVLNLTGCGRQSLTLSSKKPNTQTDNPNRVITSTNNSTGNNAFGGTNALTYYSGDADTQVLQGISVARGTTSPNQLKIMAPNLGATTSICVVTGVSYSNNCGFGQFFYDVGEERCQTVSGGVGIFTMVRTNFNVVTVILHSDVNQFSQWAQNQIERYPGLVQGQIEADLVQTCPL